MPPQPDSLPAQPDSLPAQPDSLPAQPDSAPPPVSTLATRLTRWLPWLLFLLLASLVAYSWMTSGIAYQLLRPDTAANERIAALQQYFDELGMWAPLVYVLFVVVEVVIAPLPGLLLYAPGGMIFGPAAGGALSLLGNTLGAGLACLLTRSWGDRWLGKWIARESLEPLQTLLERRGGWIILLLRVNPLTSSDMVSYAAGFSRISVVTVMLATALGMAPLCYAQAYLSDGLFRVFPGLVYPLLGLCIVYLIVLLMIMRRWSRRQHSRGLAAAVPQRDELKTG